jgi:hypothetical protein
MVKVQSNGWEHPFCKATVTCALDVSETTDAGTLRAEATFIRKVVKQLALGCRQRSCLIIRDSALLRCVPAHREFDHLKQLENLHASGPARPALILQHDKSVASPRKSTVRFLMTNGDIAQAERNLFTKGLLEAQIHGTTLVTIKFGDTASMPMDSGFELAASLHALCPNHLSLFYDTRHQEIRIMQRKGVFKTLLSEQMCPDINGFTMWDTYPTLKYEQLNMISVPVPTALVADEVMLGDGLNSFRLTLAASRTG